MSVLITRAAKAIKASDADANTKMLAITILGLYDDLDRLTEKVRLLEVERQKWRDAAAPNVNWPAAQRHFHVDAPEPSREEKLREIRKRHGWPEPDPWDDRSIWPRGRER